MEPAIGDQPFRPAEGKRLDAFVDAAFAFAVSLLIIAGGDALTSIRRRPRLDAR